MASQVQNYAKTISGLDQYAVEKFGQALEVIPRTIAENSGHKAEELIAQLYSECLKSKTVGIDVEQGAVKECKIYDSFEVKSWALKLSADTALTILNIDQVFPHHYYVVDHGEASRRAEAQTYGTQRRRR